MRALLGVLVGVALGGVAAALVRVAGLAFGDANPFAGGGLMENIAGFLAAWLMLSSSL